MFILAPSSPHLFLPTVLDVAPERGVAPRFPAFSSNRGRKQTARKCWVWAYTFPPQIFARNGLGVFSMQIELRPPVCWRKQGASMRLLLNWVLSALAVEIVAHIVPGIYVNGLVAALIAALVIGFINATLGLLLKILTFPLT